MQEVTLEQESMQKRKLYHHKTGFGVQLQYITIRERGKEGSLEANGDTPYCRLVRISGL